MFSAEHTSLVQQLAENCLCRNVTIHPLILPLVLGKMLHCNYNYSCFNCTIAAGTSHCLQRVQQASGDRRHDWPLVHEQEGREDPVDAGGLPAERSQVPHQIVGRKIEDRSCGAIRSSGSHHPRVDGQVNHTVSVYKPVIFVMGSVVRADERRLF